MPSIDTQFKAGQPGGPGRPKGSKNKLCEDFLTELHSVFKELGREAMWTTCKERPSEFIRIIAGLVPKELVHEIVQEEKTTWVINAQPALTNAEWQEKYGAIAQERAYEPVADSKDAKHQAALQEQEEQ